MTPIRKVFQNLLLRFILPLFVLLLDQALKTFSRTAGKSFFNSAIFGIEFGDNSVALLGVLLLVLASIFLFWIRKGYPMSLGLILAGGMSNLFDRIVYGGVFDYLHVAGFYFNLADLFVWIGCLLVLFSSYSRARVQSNM